MVIQHNTRGRAGQPAHAHTELETTGHRGKRDSQKLTIVKYYYMLL